MHTIIQQNSSVLPDPTSLSILKSPYSVDSVTEQKREREREREHGSVRNCVYVRENRVCVIYTYERGKLCLYESF